MTEQEKVKEENYGKTESYLQPAMQGKMKEIRMILEDLGCRDPFHEGGRRADPDIVEDGDTFAENAVIKAKRSLGAAPAVLCWQMTPALWWMHWAESRAFIPHAIWERRPPMRSRTGT